MYVQCIISHATHTHSHTPMIYNIHCNTKQVYPLSHTHVYSPSLSHTCIFSLSLTHVYILPLSHTHVYSPSLSHTHTLHTFYPQDRTIAVWDMKSPKDIVLRRVLVGHRAAVNVVDFDEKYIVSASGDRTIKVGLTVVLFPGVEDGEEKEHLVHTVCACTPKNLWRLCLYMYTGDIKTCRIDVPVDILFE